MLRPAIVLALGSLVLGTAFEAGIALRWISMGALPGEDPAGRGPILLAALLSLAAGGLMLIGRAAVGSVGDRLSAILGPLSASFVVARFLSFDAYYLPTLRRMSTGIAPASLVVATGALGVVAAATTLRWPRAGQLLTGVTMLLGLLVALAAGSGH